MQFKKDKSLERNPFTFFVSPMDNINNNHLINKAAYDPHFVLPNLSSYTALDNNGKKELLNFDSMKPGDQLLRRQYTYRYNRPESSEEDKKVNSFLTF